MQEWGVLFKKARFLWQSAGRGWVSFGVVLCGLGLRSSAADLAQQGTPRIPPAEQLLGGLRHQHPRLLVTEADFSALQTNLQSEPLRDWQRRLSGRARRILSEAPSRYEIPDGLRLLATSRRVLDRIYTLALLYRLEKDRRYLARAWQELQAAASFPDWNPRHFLDTAEMTHAFAIAYDWLYAEWTAEQRQTLRQAIVEKGLNAGLKTYRAHNWWAAARHNWNQVCNGGMGMGALAIADDEPRLAGEILHAALESLPLAMAEYAPDGAWKEGPGYWNYATSYNVVLLAALRTALGTDFGLAEMQGFDQTGLFPLYLTGPLGRTFNYADGGDNAIRAPEMFWLARRFQEPVLAWYERRLASPSALDLVWFDAKESDPKSAQLPADRYFRAAEVATLRSAWEDANALFIGFKAGDNKANHSHLDLGSFILDEAGVRWAEDLGADDYNLPGYFGKQRWEYYRLRAEGHNTLVLNPGRGPDQDPSAAARIIRFNSTPERAFAIADLTGAYVKSARKVWRGVAREGSDTTVIEDEINCAAPAELFWFMHTPASIHIQPGGRVAVLEEKGRHLLARIATPGDAVFEEMEAQPLAGSPHPERQAENNKIRKLAIRLREVKEVRLCVVLSPPNESQSAESAKVSPLSDW